MIYSDKKIIYLIIFLSLINSLFYNLFFDNSILYTDANEYDQLAKNILKGYFSLHPEHEIITMKREPLYPLFISIIYFIFGEKLFWVQFFQIFIFVLICLITYFFARDFLSKKIAIISAVLTSCLPTLANYSAYLLTEIFFTFLLILFVYIFSTALKKNSLLLFLISGFVLGLSALTKAIIAPFAFFIFILIIFFIKKLNISIVNIFIFLFIFIITISPWSYRNYKFFNTFEISTRGGDALWMSASTIDYDRNKLLQNLTYNFSEYLGNYFYPNITETPREFILLRNQLYQNRQQELIDEGLNLESEIDNELKKEAILKIISKPHIYVFHRTLEFQKMLSFMYIPALNQSHFMEYVSKYNNGNFFLSLIKAPFKISGYLIFFISLYSMLRILRTNLNLIILPIVIIYFNLMYSLLFGLGRYSVPLIPIYLILFIHSLVLISQKKNNL